MADFTSLGNDSAAHSQRIVEFFRQLRESSDFSSCDVHLQLSGGAYDHLHSVIASAHSLKFARRMKTNPGPLTINMKKYSASAVRLVVDWLYTGNIEVPASQMLSVLRISCFLGFSQLHRKIELTLRENANGGKNLVWALNMATHDDSGVSCDTLNWIVRAVVQFPLRNEEIHELRVPSVVALVSANVDRISKAALMNIAIEWFNVPGRTACIDHVFSSLYLPEMVYSAANALRDTIIYLLRRSPQSRDVFRVELKENGYNIKTQPKVSTSASRSSTLFTETEITSCTEKTELNSVRSAVST